MAETTYTQLDYSGERTSVRFNMATPTDTTSLTAYNTAVDDIRTAIEGVTIGTMARVVKTLERENLSGALPGSNLAQRELKIVVFMADDVTADIFKHEIGCPDFANLTIAPGTDVIDITASPFSDLVSELNGNVLSKQGNGATVQKAVISGRNL